MRKINCIKIDPFKRTVVRTQLDGDDLKSFYREMSNEFVACELVEVFRIEEKTLLILDEAGGLKRNSRFHLIGFGNIFSGIAIICSESPAKDPEDGSVFDSATADVMSIFKLVRWEDQS